MEIPFATRTLANGLRVVVHEDHHVPMAAVSVWYHVGSRHERPGRTGFAHLFEHLMFKGSAHSPDGYFEPLQAAGAMVNGSTNTDRTNYWEVVPADALELALWLESDRMGHLLPALSEAKFATEREVVLNERRQNYENRPYGLTSVALAEALFPPGHPYSWVTIGAPADLVASSVDDARAFFSRFYHPANASLTVAGDVDAAEVFALIERYFGPLPAGAEVVHPQVSAALPGEIRLVLEDRVELPRLSLAWHSPKMFDDEDAALDLAADVLASGKGSRLYRALVHDARLAIDVSAAQASREMSSVFHVVATAAPDRTLDDIDAVVREVLAGFAASGPTADELERATARAEAHFVYRLQTIGGFGGKSDQLNAYNVFTGTPGYFAADLARFARQTAASVADAVRRHLCDAPRVALGVVPRGQVALALPGSRVVQPS
ncbi:MAG: M16 family metallopeptidase [Vicinamibacterales bacterium]